ncbi:MAG: hypothetical protein NVSMB4_00580 [Acidimicrobiales bacterium]
MPFVQGSLVTLADTKLHLNIPATDTSNDVELQGFMDTASAIVGYEAGPITQTTFTETYTPSGSRIMLRQVPVVSVTSVVEYLGRISYTLTSQPPGSTVDNYGYSLDIPDAGLLVRRGGAGTETNFWGSPVVVVYVAGLATTPPDIRLAALEDIRDLYQQSQQGQRPGGSGSAAQSDQWGPERNRMFPRLAALLDRASRTQSIG